LEFPAAEGIGDLGAEPKGVGRNFSRGGGGGEREKGPKINKKNQKIKIFAKKTGK